MPTSPQIPLSDEAVREIERESETETFERATQPEPTPVDKIATILSKHLRSAAGGEQQAADYDFLYDQRCYYCRNKYHHAKDSHDAAIVDREEAAKMAFDTVKAVMESGNNYTPLQIAAMTAANIRHLTSGAAQIDATPTSTGNSGEG